MNFRELFMLVEGAKKNRSGAVGKRVADAAGPSGRAAGIDFSSLNPEKRTPRKEPKDQGSGSARDTTRMLKYALEIVGSFAKERGDFGRALEGHVGQINNLRVYTKRYQGAVQELGKFQRALEKETASTSPNKDKIRILEGEITKLEETAVDLDRDIRKLDDVIERNLQRKALVGELNDIIRSAAQNLSDKLSPQQKENIKNTTDVKSLDQLDTGLININDPEQLFLIKKAIIEPKSFSPLDKFYDLSMGQREDARNSGASYYFKDPIFHLASLYKTASIKSVFGKGRSSLTNSHVMRSTAKQKIGDELLQIADAIKSKSVQIAIANLKDADFLSSREVESANRTLKKVEDLILTAGSIDQDKKSKIVRAYNAFRRGEMNESAMLGVIYNINESFNFNILANDLLKRLLS